MMAEVRFWRDDGSGGVGLVTKSCPTLVTPWIVALQAPLSMGFPRQEYSSELLFPSPGDLPDPWIEPMFPALAGEFFYRWATREDQRGDTQKKRYST